MPNDGIARVDRAIARLAEGRRHVEEIIARQNQRLAANAEMIEEARQVLSRPEKPR